MQRLILSADLLIPAELGVGGTSVAAVLMGSFTATEAGCHRGPGSGTTDAMWKTKVTVIRDAMFRIHNLDGIEVIKAASSPSFAALVGTCVPGGSAPNADAYRRPLTATAAVYAEKLAPGVKHWLYAASATWSLPTSRPRAAEVAAVARAQDARQAKALQR